MEILSLGIQSIINFISLGVSGKLHLKRGRINETFRVGGGNYTIFRETVSDQKTNFKPCVLIVGFRLKIIRSNTFFHWLFERVCILTTPIWSGFAGFRIKLWLVDRKTKNYLGIYRYERSKNAKTYADYLTPILRFVSTRESVWYEIKDQEFEDYLKVAKQLP